MQGSTAQGVKRVKSASQLHVEIQSAGTHPDAKDPGDAAAHYARGRPAKHQHRRVLAPRPDLGAAAAWQQLAVAG